METLFEVRDVLGTYLPVTEDGLASSRTSTDRWNGPSALSPLGARVVAGGTFRGVQYDLLDLATWSATGTFKDWVAQIATLRLLSAGVRSFVAQSSGNTANALSHYSRFLGMKSMVFVPSASAQKILRSAASEDCQVVYVQASEEQIKAELARVSQSLGVPVAPTMIDQLVGNGLRADFVQDAQRSLGRTWGWHVQALSSAYGPFGFYHRWEDSGHSEEGPQFLGVQQEGACPYFQAFVDADVRAAGPLMEPTLFRATLAPELVSRMTAILDRFGGGFCRVRDNELEVHLEWAVETLRAAGIAMYARARDRRLHELAPVYSLVGMRLAIEAGLIESGTSALVVVTGGVRPSEYLDQEPDPIRTSEMGAVARKHFARHSDRPAC